MRSICRLAEVGSHLISSATSVTAPAAASPYREMRKIEPRRTVDETTSPCTRATPAAPRGGPGREPPQNPYRGIAKRSHRRARLSGASPYARHDARGGSGRLDAFREPDAAPEPATLRPARGR